MPELNYAAASQAAMNLRGALLPIAYALAFLGWGFSVWRAHGHGESLVKYFILIAIVVLATSGFPIAMETLQGGIKGLAADNSAHTNNQFWLLLHAQLTNEPSVFNVGAYVGYLIVKILQGIGLVGVAIVDLLQNVSVLALVAISPIMLGMLLTPVTQTAGLRFCLMAATIILWPIGTQLVDLLLLALGPYIFGIALASGGAAGAGAVGTATAVGVSLTTVALPALVLVMTVAALTPILLYASVPIFFHVVMQGGSPITAALSSGTGLAAAGSGIAGMAASRSIGTAAALARTSSSAAIGSMPPIASSNGNGSSNLLPPAQTQGATPPSSVTGGASAPESGYASAAFDASNAAAREAQKPKA